MSAEQPKPTPDVANYYDEFADTGLYDQDAEAFGWLIKSDVLVAQTLEAKPARDIKSVLDLGAGTGITITALKKHLRPERLVAVDTSPKMLNLLRAKYPGDEIEVHADTIQHYVGASQEKFDLITAFSALEYLPNLPHSLRDTARLLNENGILAFTFIPQSEGDPPEALVDSTEKMPATMFEYHWPSAEIEQTLTDSGLTIAANRGAVQLATEEVQSLEYDFIVAQKPAA